MKNITTPIEIGNIIKKARKDQQMTQTELAAVAGVGVRFIVDIEKGKQTCEIGKTLNVLRMLGITLRIE
ncbi:MAG: helix-turn-helix transcriptional regulator [Cyanobacteriota bacterium]